MIPWLQNEHILRRLQLFQWLLAAALSSRHRKEAVGVMMCQSFVIPVMNMEVGIRGPARRVGGSRCDCQDSMIQVVQVTADSAHVSVASGSMCVCLGSMIQVHRVMMEAVAQLRLAGRVAFVCQGLMIRRVVLSEVGAIIWSQVARAVDVGAHQIKRRRMQRKLWIISLRLWMMRGVKH